MDHLSKKTQRRFPGTGRARCLLLGALCLLVTAVTVCACAFSDDERCIDGYDYVNNNCVPEAGPEDTGDTVDTRDAGDTGGDSSGLGEVCSGIGSTECKDKGFTADFCAGQPGKSGYCTTTGCSLAPDNCPSGYRCCDMSMATVPIFCVSQADYEIMGTQCKGK